VRRALVADTGGLLRALARTRSGAAAFPEFEAALLSASRVLVPGMVLAEVDYFLRNERVAMRQLVSEIVDPATTYEYVPTLPEEIARALVLDAKFHELGLGLVDGVVAATAERAGVHRILTTDRRDFATLRIGRRYDRRLELVP
jgi:predicted nucleic acid-binding protein